MINFEDLIDFLAQKGVKSLHIEMHDSKLLNEEKEGLNRRFDELRKREGVPQTFLVDGKLVSATALTEYEITEIRTAIAKAEMARVILNPDVSIRASGPVGLKIDAKAETIVTECTQLNESTVATSNPKSDLAVSELAKTIPSEPSVSGGEKKPDPAQLDPAKPENEKLADTPSTTPKNVYEAFCDLVSKDDGSVTKEQRLELISKMGLDDLLRVNNDFQLGLDTDKPTEDIRADVAECF